MECGAIWFRNMDHRERRLHRDLRLLKCGIEEERRRSAGQNTRQLKKYLERLEKKDSSDAQ